MKKIRHLLAILMTVTMIMTGTCLDGFAVLSYAAEDQDDPAVVQEQDVSVSEEPAAASENMEVEADDSAGSEISEAKAENDAVDAELVHKTLKTDTVRLEGMMPEDADAEVTDAADTKAVKKLESDHETILAAYDITINADGTEYQPDTDNPILVQISAKAIKKDSDLTIWHIKDNGKREQVKDFEVSKGKVTFEATGFSVYAIVELPSPSAGGQIVSTLDELAAHAGTAFCLSYDAVNYMTSALNGNGAFQTTTEPTSAVSWYFEKVNNNNDNKYYIYVLDDNTKYYMHAVNASDPNVNNMELVAEGGAKTAFEVSLASDGKFWIKVDGIGKWLQYSKSGGGVRLYKNNDNDKNSQFTISYADNLIITSDPFGIDGKSYGIIFYDGNSIFGKVLDAEVGGVTGSLKASDLPTLEMQDRNAVKFVVKDGSITMWTFEWIEGTAEYYLKSGGKYLSITGNGLFLTDSPNTSTGKITIYEGSDSEDGKYRLASGSFSIWFNGSNYYKSTSNSRNTNAWLNLVDESSLEEGDILIYTARKISVSSPAVTTGTEVILYTRIWNGSNYEFYMVDYDGTMKRIYESGDVLQWTANSINKALWQFTEYHYDEYADPLEPNGYYELKNSYTGECLRPQKGEDVILTDDPDYMNRSVNLRGRDSGSDYTDILSWEDAAYSYRGLKVVDDGAGGKKVVACPEEEADDFYFATMKETEQQLTTVDTVDNSLYGIKIKMSDYKYEGEYAGGSYRQQTQFDLLGLDTNRAGMVQSRLNSEGFPVSNVTEARRCGDSLKDLFSNSGHTTTTEVNHLFPQSVYEESGYFEFDSTQNFATLQKADGTLDTNFTVFDQLGTTEAHGTVNSMWHGQFLPYNDIRGKTYSTKLYNRTDTVGNELSDQNPRKGERLYNIPGRNASGPGDTSNLGVNYFFGMELDASFTQTPSGKDAWGHDILFEFSGDDDMWFFVDDILVMDMGGVHSAMRGSVNFCTGKVQGRTGETTLYECFRNAGLSPAELDKIFVLNGDNQYVFKDYTTHTMKMFYMERGAGSSNLYMRLNLAAVMPGHVLLGKKVSGADSGNLSSIEYPFKIYYTPVGESTEQVVTPDDPNVTVNVQGTENPVTYKNGYYGYYWINPDQTADIGFQDEEITYRIEECGINGSLYDTVKINSDEYPIDESVTDYTVGNSSAKVKDRPMSIFENHVRDGALGTLKIKKVLKDEHGTVITDDPTTFDYRLSIGGPDDNFDNLSRAKMQPYFVLSPAGKYCRWDDDQQNFVETIYTDCDTMLAAIKDGTAVPAGLTISKVRFISSANGAISKIPAGYTVEVRDLLDGTKYCVTEESYEIPVGYQLVGYSRTITDDQAGDQGQPTDQNKGELLTHQNHTVTITNKRGWGLLANKVWSDEAFVSGHDYTYFAVYIDDGQGNLQLVNDTVRRIDSYNTTRYFFDSISGDFSNYKVLEVKLNEDYPTNNVTPILNGTIDIKAKPVGSDEYKTYTYTPDYKQGKAQSTYKDHPTEAQENIRTDTVTNIRNGGVKIVNEDTDGHPLQYAEFKLFKKVDGEFVDVGTYISNKDGLITDIYLEDGTIGHVTLGDGTYKITEVKSPTSHQALIAEDGIEIVVSGKTYTIDGSSVSHTGQGYSYETAGTMPTLTIQNKPYTLKLIKVDENNYDRTLKNAEFSLYREVMSVSGPIKDYNPILEEKETEADGIIPDMDESLASSSYYLTETKAPSGYEELKSDIKFSISPRGEISVISGSATLVSNDEESSYIIYVENASTGIVAPTGYTSYMWPLIWTMLLGMFLYTAMNYMRRRRGIEAFAMEAAGADAYEDNGVDIDFAADDIVENEVSEVQSGQDEPEYEAFDWTRIII